uniref:Uncharacterized protein n=1 Tax=Syphacia muris TaxID=451379 RepID=A0A0N5ACK1_9BILA
MREVGGSSPSFARNIKVEWSVADTQITLCYVFKRRRDPETHIYTALSLRSQTATVDVGCGTRHSLKTIYFRRLPDEMRR